ncbi:hypothetical protein AVEN_147029-1 [Araneus ventricosus]|uniref:Uncharacterized protein n=1 Tax=Araneus ventricosus TaxID=182803 RepID=A0A4Y2NIH7_ARAVE|nr:hypothetical protein AVEN_129561-1 [Araneus ventricosus]GBN38604.1 hypothetical protein AVEN_147029-1 [Araneus ventricosus]
MIFSRTQLKYTLPTWTRKRVVVCMRNPSTNRYVAPGRTSGRTREALGQAATLLLFWNSFLVKAQFCTVEQQDSINVHLVSKSRETFWSCAVLYNASLRTFNFPKAMVVPCAELSILGSQQVAEVAAGRMNLRNWGTYTLLE